MKCQNCNTLIQSTMPRAIRQGKYYHMRMSDCLKTSHFGSKLKSLRKKYRVSAKKLAKASGVSINYVYTQEKKIISDELFKKLRGHILEIKDKRPGPKSAPVKEARRTRSKTTRAEREKQGLAFKLLRTTALGLSRKKLGAILKVNEDRIESWERGMGTIPREFVEKTKSLQHKPGSFLDRAGGMVPTVSIPNKVTQMFKQQDFTPPLTKREQSTMLLKPGKYEVQNINDSLSFTPIEADINVLTKLQEELAQAKQQLKLARQDLADRTGKYDALVSQVQGLKALINI